MATKNRSNNKKIKVSPASDSGDILVAHVSPNNDVLWIDPDKQNKKEKQKPVTKKECLDLIIKMLNSEIFVYRNLSNRKTDDEIDRIGQIREYIKENLK